MAFHSSKLLVKQLVDFQNYLVLQNLQKSESCKPSFPYQDCQSYILSCLILCWWLNIMKVFSVESLQFSESFPCVQSSNQFIFYFSSLWEPRWTSMKLIYEGKLMCNTHFRKQYTHCIYSEKNTIFSFYLWKVKI